MFTRAESLGAILIITISFLVSLTGAMADETSAALAVQATEDTGSNFSVSISDSAKQKLLGNEVNFMNSVKSRAKALEANQAQGGVPDAVYLTEPVEADNPVTQSFMSRMQNISRFKNGGTATDWKQLDVPGKAFVYRYRDNKVFLNRGRDYLRRGQKYDFCDGRSGRVMGIVEINSTNGDYSLGKLTQGSEQDIYEGCYIAY